MVFNEEEVKILLRIFKFYETFSELNKKEEALKNKLMDKYNLLANLELLLNYMQSLIERKKYEIPNSIEQS